MTAWKDLERRVCRALGGERRGPTGVTCSDCSDNVPFAVEIKRAKRGVPEGAWIEAAREHGRREKKPWLLVVSKHLSRRPVVVLDFWVFAELCQAAGQLGTVEVTGPLDGSKGSPPPATGGRRSTSTSTSPTSSEGSRR